MNSSSAYSVDLMNQLPSNIVADSHGGREPRRFDAEQVYEARNTMFDFRLDQPVPARVFRAVSAGPDARITGLQAVHIQPIQYFSTAAVSEEAWSDQPCSHAPLPTQIRAEFALAAGINGSEPPAASVSPKGTTI